MAALALIAGCTGDDEGDASAGDPDAADAASEDADPGATADSGSPEAFAAEYTAAAERYAEALEDIQEERAPVVADDPVGAHEVYDELRAVTEAARADFAALDPPSELSDDLDGILTNFAAQISTLADTVEAARERDDRALQRGLEDYADQLSVWRERHTELTAQLDDA